MFSKAGNTRHQSLNIVPKHQGDQEYYGRQSKIKVCAKVTETNNKYK